MDTDIACEAYLRRGEALLGQLADVIGHLLSGDFQPGGRAPLVREGALRDTLPAAVHAPHLQYPRYPPRNTYASNPHKRHNIESMRYKHQTTTNKTRFARSDHKVDPSRPTARIAESEKRARTIAKS